MNEMLPMMPLAYIDPGSGSYFFQLVLAGLLAGLYALKVFWSRVALFLRSLFRFKKK